MNLEQRSTPTARETAMSDWEVASAAAQEPESRPTIFERLSRWIWIGRVSDDHGRCWQLHLTLWRKK